MKMKTMVVIAGSLLVVTHAKAACPELSGKYLNGPTSSSTCIYGYQIKTSSDNQGRKIFGITDISCGVLQAEDEYIVGSTSHSADSSAMPNATESITCSKDQLVISQSMMGGGTKKTFGLDANGNLVVATYMSFAGISHKEGEHTFAKK